MAELLDTKLTARMTDTADGVQVEVTDDTGAVRKTYTTDRRGGFVRRLDDMMTADGYGRTAYSASGGQVQATVVPYTGPALVGQPHRLRAVR